MPPPPAPPRPIPVAPASVLTAEAAWADVLVRVAVCTEWEWPPEEDQHVVVEPESRFMPLAEVRRFLDIASVTVGSGVFAGKGYKVCDVTDADRIRWARRTMDLLRLQKRDEPVTVSESLDAMDSAKLCAEAFPDLFHVKHFQDPEDASEFVYVVHWAFDEPIQPYMYSVAWLVAHASVPLAPLNSWNAAQLFDELLLGAEHDDGLPALSCTTTSGTPSSLRCTTSGSDDSDDDAPSEATILDGASAADDDVDDDDFTSTQDAAGVAGQHSQTTSHSHSSLDEGSLDAPQTVHLFVVPPTFDDDDDDGGDDGPSDELADADEADFRPRAALHSVNLWAPRRCFALALLVEVAQTEADLEDACLHEFGEALDAAVSAARDDHIPEMPQGLLERFDAFCHHFRLSRHLIAHASRAELWRRYVTALDVLVAQHPNNASLRPAPRGAAPLTLAQRAAAIRWQSRFPRWLVAAVLLQHAEALTADDMSQLLEATVLREMPWLNDFDHQVRTDVMLIHGHCPLKALTRHLQEHHRRLRGPRVPLVKGQSLVARSPFPNPNFVPKDDFQLRIFTDTVVQMRRDAFLRVFGDLAPRGYA